MNSTAAAAHLGAAFPDPPAYAREFTSSNIRKAALQRNPAAAKKILTPISAATTTAITTTTATTQSDELTPEQIAQLLEVIRKHDEDGDNSEQSDNASASLRFLQPPKLPSGEQYSMFGQGWSLSSELPTLESMGIKQLFSPSGENIDRQSELRKLNRSLVFLFLELLEDMSTNSASFQNGIERIRIILINMHHLINESRRQQALETLDLLLSNQQIHVKESISDVEKAEVAAKNALTTAVQSISQTRQRAEQVLENTSFMLEQRQPQSTAESRQESSAEIKKSYPSVVAAIRQSGKQAIASFSA
ncbi:hypothetical protein GQ42DRAFT_76976 [Ramicandelaber brevisporus]|nr:hypothetical protein GQ42DRAFT_76976 [Ramicandelaber brevisporus]